MSEVPPGFDPSDWKAWPHTAWAFRNVERFLPAATVPAPASPSPLPFVQRESAFDWDQYLTAVHATSAILVRDGGVAYEDYRQGMARDDRHTLFSITKSIVGLIALILIDRGTIDPARTVADHVTELRGTGFGTARIADLLEMQDGVLFGEDYADPASDVHAYSRHYWGGSPGGTLHALSSMKAARIERSGFAYRTPVADVVAWVLRRAAGQSLAALASELIWQPIGAEADALFICDTAGDEIGGTGFTARPRDLARLALCLLQPSSAIFPASVLGALVSPLDSSPLEGAGYATRPGWSYAGLWWHMGQARIAALGVYGQRMMLDHATGTALIVTAAAPSADTRALDHHHQAAFGQLCQEDI